MKMKQMILLSFISFMIMNIKAEASCNQGHQCFVCGENETACYGDFDEETGKLTITGNGEMTGWPWSGIMNDIVSADIQGVTSISRDAFMGAENLEEVNIGESVKTIGYRSFYHSGLPEIVIPDTVTSVGEYALSGKVYCPKGIECHPKGEVIFYEKTDDGQYKIGDEIYSSLENASLLGHKMYGCGSSTADCLADFDEETGKLTITGNGEMTGWPWSGIMNDIVSADIQGVTSISRDAFMGAENLEEVNIGESVKIIGYRSFYHSGLPEIVVPDTVTSVGEYAVYGIGKVYCPTGVDCHARGEAVSYEKVGSYYSANGKMYRSLENMMKGIEMKRIYTINEATAALSDKNKNTFSVRYK